MCHASLSHTRVMRCVHLLLERCAHAGVEPGPHKQVAAEEGTHEAGDLAEAIDTLLNVLADGDDGGVAALAHAADDDAVVAGLVHFVSVEYNEKFDLGVCVCVWDVPACACVSKMQPSNFTCCSGTLSHSKSTTSTLLLAPHTPPILNKLQRSALVHSLST